MPNAPLVIVGFAWYRPETYDRLRALFEDGEKLPRTYPEWLAQAEAGCEFQKRAGRRVVRADIDPDHFPEWCRQNGHNVDAKGRTAWASLVAHEVGTGKRPEG